ncbi:hypothetical protein D3C71_1869330 [compost metagenome]
MKKQVAACLDERAEQAPQLLGGRWRIRDRRLHDGHDHCESVGANHLTDSLFGVKEFVDIGFGEANGLGQIGDRGLLVSVVSEVLGGRFHDLVTHAMVRWTACRGRLRLISHICSLAPRALIDNE